MSSSHRSHWYLPALLSTLMLSGCASMSKDECVTADWHAIGYEDGLRGLTPEHVGNHRKACAKHGVTADLAEYTAGRAQGLERYCEPRNGYRLGRGGHAYAGVCPTEGEGAFLHAYGAGRDIYTAEQKVAQLKRLIRAREQDLRDLDAAIANKEAELIESGKTLQQRAALLLELRELEQDALAARDRLNEIGLELDHRRAHLAQLKDRNPTL